MTVVLVSSTEDPAGTNIKNCLLEQSEWEEQDLFFMDNQVFCSTRWKDMYLVTIQDRTIHHEHLDREMEEMLHIVPDQIIFLSRHRSKTGEPTLTVHPIGNYGNAEFGGKPHSLVSSAPRLMTQLLRLLQKNIQQTDLKHQVCYEVTHHGPSLDVPTFFAEVGSIEEEWQKEEPASVIAQSLLELFNSYRYEQDLSKDIPVLVGIGGGHYAPRFTEIVSTKKVAFGHMIPSYHIEAGTINPEILKKAFDMTPDVSGVYLHKKALKKSQVSEYKRWLSDLGIPVVSSTELPAFE